jgi:uncharacterized membrane protein
MSKKSIVSLARSVLVEAALGAVYARWDRFDEFPNYMEGVRGVSLDDEKRFRLVSEHGGKEFVSVCEIILRIPGKRIAWRTLSGPDSSGVVAFEPTLGGPTKVTLKIRYAPSTGWENADEVGARLERNLHRFKRLVETNAPLAGREQTAAE